MGGERYNSAFIIPHSSLALAGLIVILTCAACALCEARSKDHLSPQDPAPPPMRYIPDDERAQLSAAHDAKTRTRLTIELAEGRLSRALQLTEGQRYDEAAVELGIYEALIDDAIDFLQSDEATNKNRDLNKRLELVLRSHVPRIETIRRITPADYAGNVKAALDYARRARTEALNAFYGHTVVRDGANENTSSDQGSKDTPSSPPKKEP